MDESLCNYFFICLTKYFFNETISDVDQVAQRQQSEVESSSQCTPIKELVLLFFVLDAYIWFLFVVHAFFLVSLTKNMTYSEDLSLICSKDEFGDTPVTFLSLLMVTNSWIRYLCWFRSLAWKEISAGVIEM